MGLHVGTSGWTYADWEGVFYPEGLKGTARLEYYAKIFDTVEVNATFYRVPTANVIASWNRRLSQNFHMVLKGTRLVTHKHRLKDVQQPLGWFWERVKELKTLKVILWQLPPSLRKDLGLVESFLDLLPRDVAHALEFRHKSWWEEDVVELLRAYGVSFVAVSHPKLPSELVVSSKVVYVRFHGLGPKLYRYDYSEEELAQWATKLAPLVSSHEVYAFFNNDYEANAPRNALTLRGLVCSSA